MSLSSRIKKESRVLYSVFSHPKPKDLSSFIFAITFLCNSKCRMCNIWQKYKNNSKKFREELTVDEIRALFSKSDMLRKIDILGLAGGEPFLKKDFVEIALFFYKMNSSLITFIPSNGQSPELIKEKLTELVKNGVRNELLFVGFSLDGIEETHDKMRGVEGAFRRVLQSADCVRKIERVNLGLSFTFTPENYREFAAVHDLSKRLEIRLGFQFAQTSSHYYGNTEKKFSWTEDQIAEIREMLLQKGYLDKTVEGGLAYRLVNPDNYFLEYVLKYQLKPHRSFDCFSGTHSCYMDPYGNVFPCISLDESFGNIREQDFDELWTSPTAKQVRRIISRRKCHCCSFCDIPRSLLKNWRVIPWNLKKQLIPRQ
jgi:MoaA/NifB/PqqE/SkfB family radical SAM enzyme